jgi:hypothetical protein
MGRSKKAPQGAFLLVDYYYFKYRMTHKLLVVTYPDDLKQFEMFCYCLEKNWQGSKNLIVVTQQDTDQQVVQKIIDHMLLDGWNVEINQTACSYKDRYNEQQVNKIFYSVNSAVDDVVVFDSKDFVLRPCDFSTFKSNEKYRVTYYLPNKLVESYPDIKNVVDKSVDHLPNVSNLTPWIWNVGQLTRYWNHINNKFNNYKTWKHFPACTEIYGYYVFAWTEDNNEILWHKHPKKWPLLVSGGWTHQTYNGILESVVDFNQNPERIVWKHSRKLEDPRCIEVTRLILIKYGIDKQFVDQIYG